MCGIIGEQTSCSGGNMKKCSMCKIEKSEVDFHKATSARDGLNYYCKMCNNLHANKYKLKNKEKIKERDLKSRNSNPSRRLYYSVKARAKKYGLEFNIEPHDIVIPDYCPLTGIKIDTSAGEGRKRGCPSVDRIDNTKGYVKGNIRVVSDLGNRMKSDASKAELLEFSTRILRYISNEDISD